MNKKYDIFISYRRNGGDMVSARLYDSLREKKYRVFQDEKEMGACLFDERLRQVISQSKDFVLVLTPGALDRCGDPEDWVRKEIEWAQISGCNIIPVRTQSFVFPEGMPAHIKKLDMHNGPMIVASHWESFVVQLTKYFKTKHFPWKRVAGVCAAAVVCCVLGAAVLKFNMPVQYAQLRSMAMSAEDALERGKISKKNQEIDVALAYFNAAVGKGSADAANLLADMYYNADNVKQDYTLALEYYLKAAELDASKANEVRIGYMYDVAQGTQEDDDKAFEWYMLGAEKNDKVAINNVGWIYEQKGEAETALEWYLKAAEMGDPYAMGNLGHAYYEGVLTEKNDVKALGWYEKAEKAGRKQTSMFRNIGVLYEELRKDYSKAVGHYQTAASDGDAEANYRLGRLYENGKAPGGKNEALALEHYEKAANKDHAGALNALGDLYYEEGSAIQNDTLALEYYLKAAEISPESAQFTRIGYMYNNGKGAQKDENKALEWYLKGEDHGKVTSINNAGVIFAEKGDDATAYTYYLKAAEMGNKYAMSNLGTWYYEGRYVEQDYAKALEWFLKAENAGQSDGTMFHRMGWMYHYGQGTKKDERKALHYYEKDEIEGCTSVLTDIGVLYESATTIPKDLKKAYEYYDRAAQKGNIKAHYRLGRMYLYGNDVVPKNSDMAAEYLRVVAEDEGSDHEDAPKLLAQAYVDQNMYDEALP